MNDTSSVSMFGQILILLVLTAINAFFACAEMAIASVNRNKIKILAETTNEKRFVTIYNLLKDPTKFLSTIQVAITLAGFLASASAATSFSSGLGKQLQGLGVPYSDFVAIAVVTLILSYFTLILGELVPKRIALQSPETIAKMSVNTILFISKILSPFVMLLTVSTNIVLRLLGLKSEGVEEEVSEEEIRSMVELGKNTGSVDEEEQRMINSVFEFNDKIAKEIMIPRVDVFALDINKPLCECWDLLFEMKYSRIPVYENDIDNIVGILNMKNIIEEAKKKGFDNVDLRQIIHKPFFISEHIKIDQLFKEMKKNKKYIAIIVDEYGGFAGLLTMEDLVEEIVGDIEDEYDDEKIIEKISDDEFIIKGVSPLDDIKYNLGIDIESDKSNTISGYIMEKIMKVPDETCVGITIEEQNYLLCIQEVKENRVEKVKLKLINQL